MNGDYGGDRSSSVGSLLREWRLKCDVSLTEAARTLRIRQSYLAAIEGGRVEDLPGPTYATGFVRAYAEYLGLDGEATARRYKGEMADLHSAADLQFPEPAADTSAPRGSFILVGALLITVAYGAWFVSTSHSGWIAELVAPLPERLTALLPRPEIETEVVDVEPARGSVAPAAAEPRPATNAGAPMREPAPPTSLAAAAPEQWPAQPVSRRPSSDAQAAEPSPSPATKANRDVATLVASAAPRGGDDTATRVVLRATGTSWVEIRDGAGTRVVGRLMEPGETIAVPDQPGLRMTVGNAGGIEVVVDGSALPPLGGIGVVRRGVALDAERLLAATANP